MSKVKLQTSLRLLMTEMVITSTLLAMPILVPFYYSLGMTQGQVGLSQAFCAIAALALNIPTGWIADRFSRKTCNAIGDFGSTFGALIYSQAHSFGGVILGEIIMGLSFSVSNGADDGLVKGHVEKIDPNGSLLHHVAATVAIWKPIAQVFVLSIATVIGPNRPRIALAASAVPYFIGGVLSLVIREEGPRLISQHRNPFRDMARVCKETIVPNPLLRWLIFASAVGLRITGVMIWALSPLLIKAGVPGKIIGIGWILYNLTVMAGAWLAKRFAKRFTPWQQFAIPGFAIIIALSIMSIHLSITTIWLYAILGAGYGWNDAVLKPMLQREIPACNQATALSLAGTLSKLFYVPLVWVVGIAGIPDIRLSMVATIAIFLPMIVVITCKLKKLET